MSRMVKKSENLKKSLFSTTKKLDKKIVAQNKNAIILVFEY